jgi:hypothetical protein
MSVTTTNDGPRPLRGHFGAEPYDTTAAFYSRREGEEPLRIDEPYVPEDRGLTICQAPKRPVSLGGGESVATSARFVLDPRTRGLRFPSTGEYEMFVVLRPFGGSPRKEVRSNAIRILVAEPPQHFRAAFDAYLDSQLEQIVGASRSRLMREPESAVSAEAFLMEHADSPYARHVREALVRGLRARMSTNKATLVEKAVYGRVETNESIRRSMGFLDRRP